MDISNQRLQEIINVSSKHDEFKASRILEIKPSSLERFLREAKARSIGPEENAETVTKRPNVLIFDIETSLMAVHVWSPGQQYVGPSQIIQDWHTLSWACKWLFEPEIYSDVLTPEEAADHNDDRIVRSMWEYLDHADIIIAHNGARFDVRKLNSRFMHFGLLPPSPYQVIDTLLQSRKVAMHSSNKQDELNKKFGLTRKTEHEGYNLWVRCFNADPEALLIMEDYNKGDVVGLEELYVVIRPWIKSHPNMNLYVEGDGHNCPNCGGDKMEWMDKFYYTAVNKYSTFRCGDCGAVGRSRASAIDKETKPKVVSVAR